MGNWVLLAQAAQDGAETCVKLVLARMHKLNARVATITPSPDSPAIRLQSEEFRPPEPEFGRSHETPSKCVVMLQGLSYKNDKES